MTLIERYIDAVADRLPEKLQADVKLELRSNILDMLPDEPDEEDIRQVLESMGDPAELALQYSPTKRYLIGPAVYDRYIEVLKLVLGIVAITFTVLISLDWMFDDAGAYNLADSITSYIAGTVGGVIEGLLQAALWVTVIFVILERKNVIGGPSFSKAKPWQIENLPSQSLSPKSKISRGKTITGICATIFLTFLLLTRPDIISVISSDPSGKTVTPIFNTEHLSVYSIFILAAALFSLCLSIWKLVLEKWTFPLAIGNTLFNLLICILIAVMVNDGALWNDSLQSTFNEIFAKTGSNDLITWSKNSGSVFILVVAVISLWDSIDGFLRSRGLKH